MRTYTHRQARSYSVGLEVVWRAGQSYSIVSRVGTDHELDSMANGKPVEGVSGI